MYSVFETYDSIEKRSVFGAPDNWEVERKLYWPSKSKNINVLRKLRRDPEEDWESTTNYRGLARNLGEFVS